MNVETPAVPSGSIVLRLGAPMAAGHVATAIAGAIRTARKTEGACAEFSIGADRIVVRSLRGKDGEVPRGRQDLAVSLAHALTSTQSLVAREPWAEPSRPVLWWLRVSTLLPIGLGLDVPVAVSRESAVALVGFSDDAMAREAMALKEQLVTSVADAVDVHRSRLDAEWSRAALGTDAFSPSPPGSRRPAATSA